MPERRGLRKCSICNQSGHNKSGHFRFVERKSGRKEKIVAAKSPIMVRILRETAESPHVIDLRGQKELVNVWDKAPVFQEENNDSKIVTKILDLANAIKEANKEINLRNDVKKINLALKQNKKNPVLKIEKEKKEKLYWKEFVAAIKNKISALRLSNILSGFKFKKLSYYAVGLFLIAVSVFPVLGYYHKLKAANEMVVEESTDAFMALQASTVAAFQSDLGQAEQELTHALQSFAAANSIVEKDYHILLSVAKLLPLVGAQVSSRQNLLSAGSHLALGNTYLLKGIGETQKNNEIPLTEKIEILQQYLRSALPQYNEALDNLNHVDSSGIPVEYQQTFAEFKVLFGAFVNDMDDLVDLGGALKTIFGNDSFQRYLVVFQNNHELRPTGGFMGSFAVVDAQKGKILNIDVPGGGTYDLRGQLTEFVKPPLPLQLLNKRWEFQDANWFPDFAASARKMEWFYENGRGATVDGVIALNASVLERALKILGPLEAGDILLNGSDAIEKLQYEVETGYDKETEQPKEILAEILDKLMSNLTNLKSVDAISLLTELHEALAQKEIQIYMNDDNTQKSLRMFGWTGEILPVPSGQDYLAVIHTNIQGQKSDAKILQTINHEAVIDEDGNIIDTVMVERTHTGTPGEQFYGGPNISYVRVYVPEGAELIDAGGFNYPPEGAFKVPEDWYEDDADLSAIEKNESISLKTGTRVTDEFGKTVFGNWVITEPGKTSRVYFRYKLPFKAVFGELPENNASKWQAIFTASLEKQASRYSLAVQKQSGTDSVFSSTIIYPKGWLPVWKSNEEMDLALNGARYNTKLESDVVLGIAVEKNEKE